MIDTFFMRRMGLEPTRDCSHKILSLARLPIPTPPRTSSDASVIIPRTGAFVKRFIVIKFFVFLQLYSIIIIKYGHMRMGGFIWL